MSLRSRMALLTVCLAATGCAGMNAVAPTMPSRSTPHTTQAVVLSGSGLAGLAFGAGEPRVMAALRSRLGEPDVIAGPTHYIRVKRDHASADPSAPRDRRFTASADPLDLAWRYPVVKAACWQSLCLVFGAFDKNALRLKGWELSRVNRWGSSGQVRRPDLPAAHLAGSGIRLGASWRAFKRAYPSARPNGGEGSTLVIENAPWRGIFDGVGRWRLSGVWDYKHPHAAPATATVTRMSAGQGPELGCC